VTIPLFFATVFYQCGGAVVCTVDRNAIIPVEESMSDLPRELLTKQVSISD